MTPNRSVEPVEHRVAVPRTARYYTLGGGDGATDVWFVLHGYSMLARRFLRWFAPAAGPRRLIIAPEALNLYYKDPRAKKVGATWMTSEDRSAHIADYVRYLDLVHDEVLAGVGGPARVEVHGFSQGTATACRWAAFGRVRPARLVLWAGGVPPDLDLETSRETLGRAGLLLIVGDRDEFIPEDRIAAEAARLETARVPFALRRFRGGHTVPGAELERLAGEEAPARRQET